jgi:carboxymethylenebutenolidase
MPAVIDTLGCDNGSMMKGKTIQIAHNSEAFNSYFSTRGKNCPAVMVLHAWWGLNGFFRNFCDRLASEGFSTMAPDLYDGRTASTIEQAENLRSKLDRKGAFRKINATLDYLLSEKKLLTGNVGVIGFSLGGHFALDLSSARREVKAVVVFYGTSPKRQWKKSEAAYLGHFAEKDPYEPFTNVLSLEKKLKSAGKRVKFYAYQNTGHWFFESDRLDAYDRAASALAWKRTVEFLRTTLRVSRSASSSVLRTRDNR